MERLTVRINDRVSVTIDTTDIKDLVRKGSFWSELPSQCPVCTAPIALMYRNPQDNEYFGMKCTGTPAHETNFGQYKESSKGLYYKREWHNAFQGGQPGDEGQQQQQYSGPPQGTTAPYQQPQPQYQQTPQQQTTDNITPKQLGMIRALCREQGLHSDAESSALFGLNVDQMSKASASDMIGHLQAVAANQKAPLTPRDSAAGNGGQQSPQPAQQNLPPGVTVGMPPQATVGGAIQPAPVTSQLSARVFNGPPVGSETHGGVCRCPECDDIPF